VPRIPYPDPDTLSEEKRKILKDQGSRVLNVSKMVMHTPDAFWAPQRALGRAAIFDTSLGARLREIIILRVAHLSNSDYELFHHNSIASNIGVTDAELAALKTGDVGALPPEEQSVIRFVNELVENVSPSDKTLAELRGFYADPQVFEILFIACTYMAVARVIAVGGVELEESAVVGWN
jgi:4-carboxymuconolactone decarboxylase